MLRIATAEVNGRTYALDLVGIDGLCVASCEGIIAGLYQVYLGVDDHPYLGTRVMLPAAPAEVEDRFAEVVEGKVPPVDPMALMLAYRFAGEAAQ